MHNWSCTQKWTRYRSVPQEPCRRARWAHGPTVIIFQSYAHPGGVLGQRVRSRASWLVGNSQEDPPEAQRHHTAKAKAALHHHGNPGRKTGRETGSHEASAQGMGLGFIFRERNKLLNSEIFLKPLENPTLITDDSLTFFQLFRSSRQVRLLGRAQAGMLGYVWALASLPISGSSRL